METRTPNNNINHQTLDLPSSTLAERTAHAQILFELEAKKVASTLDVPTLPNQIRDALRTIGQPVRLFGENNANVRDWLSLCLARLELRNKGQALDVVGGSGSGSTIAGSSSLGGQEARTKKEEDDTQTDTKYTHAPQNLIDTREYITTYSIEKSRKRLSLERKRRWGANRRMLKRRIISSEDDEKDDDGYDYYGLEEKDILNELDDLDTGCLEQYKDLKSYALEGS